MRLLKTSSKYFKLALAFVLLSSIASSCASSKKAKVSPAPPAVVKRPPASNVASLNKRKPNHLKRNDINQSIVPVENSSGYKKLEEKYANLLDVSTSQIRANRQLFEFVDDWIGTPYQYGGTSKAGTDCSGLAGQLFKTVYGKTIGRDGRSQHDQCDIIRKENLKAGDLVFFKIGSKNISHVGVYLANNRFIHSSTSSGVMISSLDEVYYKKYFFDAGRIK